MAPPARTLDKIPAKERNDWNYADDSHIANPCFERLFRAPKNNRQDGDEQYVVMRRSE